MNMLTVNQAAQQMGVCTKTVYRLMENGFLSKVKIGRATRVSEDELNDYLAMQVKKGKATW